MRSKESCMADVRLIEAERVVKMIQYLKILIVADGP